MKESLRVAEKSVSIKLGDWEEREWGFYSESARYRKREEATLNLTTQRGYNRNGNSGKSRPKIIGKANMHPPSPSSFYFLNLHKWGRKALENSSNEIYGEHT